MDCSVPNVGKSHMSVSPMNPFKEKNSSLLEGLQARNVSPAVAPELEGMESLSVGRGAWAGISAATFLTLL